MRYFVVLSLFCLILVTIKANSYLDSDLLNDDELNYPAPDNYLDDLQAPAENSNSITLYGLPSLLFLGVLASDGQETAIIGQTDVATTHHVAAISGAPTVDVSEWDCSKNGENKLNLLIVPVMIPFEWKILNVLLNFIHFPLQSSTT
ncbi:CLUMA_CG017700, isoform A [Clunio marinus]|uniref:CLUMA_CG017700, isoform A n=1 Tax=Clunio marinus TaxID=568069 RepID=A0A1J1IWZ9_9DIPT|nr:CLUMA_CG017700, isoform A [Clunio marinus]